MSRDMFVNIMEQYRPDAHVGKAARSTGGGRSGLVGGMQLTEPGGGAPGSAKARYHEINRPTIEMEVSRVRRAAEDAGLWRFCDLVRHDGFNL